MLKTSPQKLNLVSKMIRNKPVNVALAQLKFSRKRIALAVKKCLESAVANAENNNSQDIDDLMVKNILIDEGPTGKRHMPRARGRVNEILKRSSHITVIVSDGKEV
jgi:large subunit ribosomal protein L22